MDCSTPGFPVGHRGQMRYLPCPSPCASRCITREDGQASLSITKSLGKEKSRSFGLWLLIWRFGPEENDGCQSDQSHKTQRAFLSTEHSSCICAWHLGAVGVFSAYGHLQLPGGPAHQPLVAGLGMVSFYFGASSGLLACSMATALDWRRRRQFPGSRFLGRAPALTLQSLGAPCPPLLSQLWKSSIAFQVVRDWSLTCSC